MLNTALLAALSPSSTSEETILTDGTVRGAPFWGGETSLILGAVLVVAAGLFFWAFFIRKRPQTQHGSIVLERARREDKDSERYGSSGKRRRRKRRPEHPENLPRNPTLAEIGGLPPARPDDPASPEGGDDGPSPEPQR